MVLICLICASNRQDASNSMYNKDASNNMDCMDVRYRVDARKSTDASNATDASQNRTCMDCIWTQEWHGTQAKKV